MNKPLFHSAFQSLCLLEFLILYCCDQTDQEGLLWGSLSWYDLGRSIRSTPTFCPPIVPEPVVAI